jgi:hypothetical protein
MGFSYYITEPWRTFSSHYLWFVTHNYLHKYLPKYDQSFKGLLRNGIIGFTCSIFSDTFTNSLRVLKTFRQTDANSKTYLECLNIILNRDGLKGLLFRGLGVRLFTNGLQGLLFNVLWKYFDHKA